MMIRTRLSSARRGTLVAVTGIIAGLLTGLLVVLATGVGTTGASAQGERTQVEVETPEAYPTSKGGLTYGSSREVMPEDEPDLIAVIGDTGVAGYVLKTEMDEKTNANPPDAETALRRQEELLALARKGELKVRVWDLNGKQIDWFTLDPGDDPNYEPDPEEPQ